MRGDSEAGDGNRNFGSQLRGENTGGWLKRYVCISLVLRCWMLGMQLLAGNGSDKKGWRGEGADSNGVCVEGRSADSCLGLEQEERALAEESGGEVEVGEGDHLDALTGSFFMALMECLYEQNRG